MSRSKFSAARFVTLGLLGRRDKVGVPGVAVDESVRRSEYSVRKRYFRHAKNNENLLPLEQFTFREYDTTCTWPA